MRIVKTFILILITFNSYAQLYEITGIVSDTESKENISAVHIQLINMDSSKSFFAITDLNGKYKISQIPQGEYQLICTYMGYTSYNEKFFIDNNELRNISLSKKFIDLGEVIVSSLHQNKKIKDVAIPLEIVDEKQIELASSFTASDVLQQQPGVELARDGIWSTGVNIRGLGQQRIVMLVDGNRIETATDLMASLSFFDMGDVERIEVIKGASSSLYGTGAMAGIVNVITKESTFNSTKYFQGSFNSGYYTVNELFTRKLNFNAGSKSWFASFGGSMRDARDVKTPEGKINNSQFQDQSISAKLGFKLKSNHLFKFNYQYFDADDVGIPGGDAFPGPATATYTDAKRWLISANYEIRDISERFKRLNFKYFHQYIIRDVELIPNVFTETSTSITTPEKIIPSGTHVTDGIQIQTDWNLNARNNFIIGLDTWRRKLETIREKYIRVDVLDTDGNITTTNNIIRGETPIPESCFGSAGIYMQDEQILSEDLKLTLGGRIDGIRIANEQVLDYDYLVMNGTRNDTPPNQRVTFEKNEEYKLSWSANLGLLYALNQQMDLSFNAGRSFRAPSLEESFKYIDLGNSVRLGDPNLDPEKGYSIDVGFRIWKPKFHFKINAFSNWLTDMIVEEPGEFIYSYTTGVVDTVPALINSNVDEARLYGIDFNFQYNFYRNLVIHGAGAYVRGEDTKNESDLPLIPPMNGRIGIKYSLPKYMGFDLIAIGYADQDKVAEDESKTKGFARFDLLVYSTKINIDFANIQFFGGVENIGDRAYTNHLATNRGSISVEPGRNFYLKMKILF